MLGYSLTALKGMEVGQLMPQPAGTLHTKWIKDSEVMLPKNCPPSCR